VLGYALLTGEQFALVKLAQEVASATTAVNRVFGGVVSHEE
jgi:hypothetical protein